MAQRSEEVISSLVDRENMHVNPAKQVSKLIKITRRPALDELSNKLHGPRPVLKKAESLKEIKPVIKDTKPRKLENVLKSYSSHQLQTITNPDADTKDEPQMVTEYLADIYNYLRELETQYPIREKFLEGHSSTPRMRAVLVNWLVQVHINFALCLETLHMCISLTDRYLQNQPRLGRERLQLVGTAALFIACKYEEIYAPELKDFVYICDEAFSKGEILKMEMSILISLEYNLGKPLSIHFLRRYSKIAQVRADHHNLSKYILELALLDHEFSTVKPSIQAAAACCLSLAILNNAVCPSKMWTPTLVVYTTYKYSDFQHVIVLFAKMLLAASSQKNQWVQTKYAEAKYHRISRNQKVTGDLVKKLAQASPKS